MNTGDPSGVIRLRGRISCRRDGEGPLGLILAGGTVDSPDGAVQLAFACRAPADMPATLDDVTVEKLGERQYRISSGGRVWALPAIAHVHREIAGAFYKALPPRPVPWRKRLFWRVMLLLAAHRPGRWFLLRAG